MMPGSVDWGRTWLQYLVLHRDHDIRGVFGFVPQEAQVLRVPTVVASAERKESSGQGIIYGHVGRSNAISE